MNAMIAIGVSAAPKFIRLTRGQVLAVKSEDYVQSAARWARRTCASSRAMCSPTSCRR